MFKIFPSTIKGIKKLNKIEMPNVMISLLAMPLIVLKISHHIHLLKINILILYNLIHLYAIFIKYSINYFQHQSYSNLQCCNFRMSYLLFILLYVL